MLYPLCCMFSNMVFFGPCELSDEEERERERNESICSFDVNSSLLELLLHTAVSLIHVLLSDSCMYNWHRKYSKLNFVLLSYKRLIKTRSHCSEFSNVSCPIKVCALLQTRLLRTESCKTSRLHRTLSHTLSSTSQVRHCSGTIAV